MLRRFLILLGVISTLGACTPLSVRGDSCPQIPQDKLMACGQPSRLLSGSHSEVERWAVAQGYLYRECATKQAELAEMVRACQSEPTDQPSWFNFWSKQ